MNFETPENTPRSEYENGIDGMSAPIVRNRRKLAVKYGMPWVHGAFPLDAELTPEEYFAANGMPRTYYSVGEYDRSAAEEDHRQFVREAMQNGEPYSQDAAMHYGI